MGLELERGLELFFSEIKKKKKNYNSSSLPVCSALLLYSFDAQITFCNPLVCMSNDIKIAQFG
jgi:hypothetical protein